ncbi:hypothetical protein ACFLQL_03000 [Verrucomicrobiota bacterium]
MSKPGTLQIGKIVPLSDRVAIYNSVVENELRLLCKKQGAKIAKLERLVKKYKQQLIDEGLLC